MKTYLLDTNAVIGLALTSWSIAPAVRSQIEAGAVVVSVVSGIEMAIKAQTGKLPLPAMFQTRFATAFASLVEQLNGTMLDVGLEHLETLRHLPLHHRDPFDRLLVSQALTERMTLVTRDRQLAVYAGLDICGI